MPLPLPRQPEPNQTARAEAGHYFDTAHGDVASLHARIERSLGQHAFAAMPHSRTGDRIEDIVQTASRSAGVIGLVGALALIAYALA